MSSELDRNQIAELLPLYVLDLLEPAEMEAVAAYLERHPEAQGRQAELDDVLVHLAQSTPAAPLPASARVRLFARVQADLDGVPDAAQAAGGQTAPPSPAGQTPDGLAPVYQHPLLRSRRGRPLPVSSSQASSAPVSPTTGPPAAVGPAPVLPGAPAAAARLPAAQARFGWLAVAASLALAFGLLGFALSQQARIGSLGAEVARLTGEVAQLRQQNQLLEEQQRTSQNQLALYLWAERAVALAGTELAPEAQGSFYLSNDEGVVVVSGLEPLPANLTYQLWLVPPDGVPTSVALLPIGSDGLFTQTVNVPDSLADFAIVDVSIEQAGGSPAINKETIVLRGVIAEPS